MPLRHWLRKQEIKSSIFQLTDDLKSFCFQLMFSIVKMKDSSLLVMFKAKIKIKPKSVADADLLVILFFYGLQKFHEQVLGIFFL